MISHTIFMINLLLATVLGAFIGIERQWRQRMAGLRTNALVSAGASLFVLLSQEIPGVSDQSRIASYVVSGVGFLGAGVIMKEGGSIRGLNTAATLWCSAAIGCLAGFGFYFEATLGTAVVLISHIGLRPVAQMINRKNSEYIDGTRHYRVTILCKEEVESHIRLLFLQASGSTPLVLHALKSNDLLDGNHTVEVAAHLESSSKQDQALEQIVGRLSLEKGVSGVTWASRSNLEENA